MEQIFDWIGWALVFLGVFFLFSGALGMFRMPDFFTRLHAAGVGDSLGAPLILIGIAVLSGFGLFAFKIGFLVLFLFITCPTSTHALARAALYGGLEPYMKEKK